MLDTMTSYPAHGWSKRTGGLKGQPVRNQLVLPRVFETVSSTSQHASNASWQRMPRSETTGRAFLPSLDTGAFELQTTMGLRSEATESNENRGFIRKCCLHLLVDTRSPFCCFWVRRSISSRVVTKQAWYLYGSSRHSRLHGLTCTTVCSALVWFVCATVGGGVITRHLYCRVLF